MFHKNPPQNIKKKNGDFYIMVVDEESDFLDSIKYWFTSQGYRVEALTSGAEALEKIREKKPGVVFLNLQMPHEEGIETLRAIKEIAGDVPVIMLSAFGSEDQSIDAYKVGVNGFFDKSSNFYQAEHLMNTLVRVVSRKRRPSAAGKPVAQGAGAKKRFPWLWLLALAVLALVFLVSSRAVKPEVCFAKDACLRVTLARTDEERQKGLMGRDFLPQNEGMLFIFPQEGTWGIWMKNMKIPLDIIWMDASGRVVTIARDAQPSNSPAPPIFKNDTPAKFVLEARAGLVDEYGIAIGDRVFLP
ncbi:MAG: DUF192 domain-containing protein [Candidatus Omnitrophota bacterium]